MIARKWYVRVWAYIIRDWWVVRRCTGFPYKSGYATYNPFRNMICDTGLTKQQAQDLCDVMNG